MYPQPELTRLAAHKAVLQRRIVLRRAESASAVTQVLRPLAWLDELLALSRRLAPLAAVPLGLLVTRVLLRRAPRLRALVQWSPIVLALVRGLKSTKRPARAAGVTTPSAG
jgi:hypothetical protein